MTLESGKTLKSRILLAGAWTVGAYGAEAAIRLLTSLIMTRLLFPEAFGLMAIVSTIPAALAMLSDTGIRSSIVRHRGNLDADFLRTAWTVQCIRGVILWGIMLILSALLTLQPIRQLIPAGSALANPLLPWLLATTGSVLVLGGLESVNLYVQERNIRMGPLAVRTIASKIAPVPFMIILAYMFHSVWALVIGSLISQLVALAASHIFVPGDKMRFRWHAEVARSLLMDGKWIALSSANNVLTSQGDRLILSAMMTSSQLGFYSIAWLLLESFRALLLSLHTRLTLPVLSELYRNRQEATITHYYRYRRPIELAAFTAAGGLWIVGPSLVSSLYGSRYSDAGDILKVLSIGMLALPYGMIVETFLAKGQLRIFSLLSIFNSVSFIVAVFIGYAVAGIQGVIWGLTLFRWPQIICATALAYRRNWIMPVREIVYLPMFGVGVLLGYAAESVMEWITWRMTEIL